MTEHNINKYLESECSKYSVFPQVLGAVNRIIAIGDIHGDFDLLIRSLKIARLINNNNSWNGGNTYLVQVGDQIDSCRPYYQSCLNQKIQNDKAEDTKIIHYLDQLHQQALKRGGAVISLMGNHELMNLQGDMSYVSQENLREFHQDLDIGLEKRKEMFHPTGTIGEKIICTYPPAVIIGSNLFVHAGVLPVLLQSIPDFHTILNEKMSEVIHRLTTQELLNLLYELLNTGKISKEQVYLIDETKRNLWKKIRRHQKLKTDDLVIFEDLSDKVKSFFVSQGDAFGINSLHPIELINMLVRNWLLQKVNRKYLKTIDPLNSIFWNRILGSIPNEKHKNIDQDACEKYVRPVLDFLHIENMIIGHTPQFTIDQSGISTSCNKHLVKIDTGSAKVFDMFDHEYRKNGKNMKQRQPQILEIINDKHFRVLTIDGSQEI